MARRTRTLTAPQRAKYEALQIARNKAMDAIFAVTDRTDLRFADCCKLAGPVRVDAYQAAAAAVTNFESDMIAEGRAFRSVSGGFHPY